MNILIDMNLSPEWVQWLQDHGYKSMHWSQIGPANAPDAALLNWAAEASYVILTHDLDFGDLLAASGARIPSVVLLRSTDVQMKTLGSRVVAQLNAYRDELNQGAILVIDTIRSRVRLLPLKK